MSTATEPARGEIWFVNFDPTRGHELKKMRPAVVLSSDSIRSTGLRIVVPITGHKPVHDRLPWCVPLEPTASNGLGKKSTADAYQIKCVSVDRFGRRSGALPAVTVDDISAAVAICIDI